MLPIIFWASIAVIAYTFIGYPIALAVFTRVRPLPRRHSDATPSITIVISAYNETRFIAAKIRNLLSLDYPADRIEILIGSDGSTDGTAEEARSSGDPRVQVFAFDQRRGKPAVLNALVPRARGEIVVMSDVRQMFDADALRALVRSFGDPRVGAVSGEVSLTTEAGTAVTAGSGLYWRYESFIRSAECLVDSTICVTGPIYAIRRELFAPIPPDTLVEDMLIPLRIVRRGYRVVVDTGARAIDFAYATAGQEFTRKVRTLAGNFQLFRRELWLLDPLRNRLWWQTTSHKFLRLLVAPLQIAIVSSNIALIDASRFYEVTLAAQLVFYALAIAGSVLPKKSAATAFPFFFCLLSWATVFAFFRSVTGRQPVTWQKAGANASPR